MIMPMDERYVDQVVDVHMRSFSGFFLTFLGSGFLRRYYTGFCRDERAIRIIDLTGSGEVAGLITGAMNPSGFFSGLIKKDLLGFAVAAIPAVIKKPGIIPRVFRALKRPSKESSEMDVAMILEVAVAPEYMRKGIGIRLIEAFLEEAARRGAKSVYLDTDRDDNEAANMFYQRAGFTLSREHVTEEGRWLNEYRIPADRGSLLKRS